MDPDIQILHSVGVNDLKSEDYVDVIISSDFNKLQIPQPQTQAEKEESLSLSDDQIETVWEKRILENPKLYNGTKFRVHSIHTSTVHNDRVYINVGVTDYKTYLGTNWAENIKELQLLGSRLYNNSQVFLSDALGVGSFLILKDSRIVLLKRNYHCAEAPGTWDIPGGHAEPKNIVGDIPLEDIDLSLMSGKQVCSEIFNSILQEITDEVNIPISELEKPLYMGTARNTTSGGRPSLEFLIKCSLTSENVYANYCKGNQLEADESTNIKFVPIDDIKSLQRDNKELWNSLAPSAKGCIILYQMTHNLLQE